MSITKFFEVLFNKDKDEILYEMSLLFSVPYCNELYHIFIKCMLWLDLFLDTTGYNIDTVSSAI